MHLVIFWTRRKSNLRAAFIANFNLHKYFRCLPVFPRPPSLHCKSLCHLFYILYRMVIRYVKRKCLNYSNYSNGKTVVDVKNWGLSVISFFFIWMQKMMDGVKKLNESYKIKLSNLKGHFVHFHILPLSPLRIFLNKNYNSSYVMQLSHCEIEAHDFRFNCLRIRLLITPLATLKHFDVRNNAISSKTFWSATSSLRSISHS